MKKDKILIISACFYKKISDDLLKGAVSELEKNNIDYKIIKVPGCFEIPVALHMSIKSETNYQGYIVLGCVIRGETGHYDIVCNESSRGINDFAIKYCKPLGFGIITAENYTQAEERSDTEKKNYGGRAANACIEMTKISSEV